MGGYPCPTEGQAATALGIQLVVHFELTLWACQLVCPGSGQRSSSACPAKSQKCTSGTLTYFITLACLSSVVRVRFGSVVSVFFPSIVVAAAAAARSSLKINKSSQECKEYNGEKTHTRTHTQTLLHTQRGNPIEHG